MSVFLKDHAAKAFARDESGAGMAWNIFWCVIFLLIAGLTIDTASAYRMKRILQATADSSALAGTMAHFDPAVYEDYTGEPVGNTTAQERGDEVAISIAGRIMGPKNGTVLTDTDVLYGSWSDVIGFTEGWGNHVKVTTRRDQVNNNSLPTFLLAAFGGLPSWDIATIAVAGPREGACARDGIITSDVVDMQSNNHFTNGICIYGGMGIELNQNNIFDPGVHIAMPSPDLLVTPGGQVGNNTGLEEALVWASMEPTIAQNIDTYLTDFLDISSDSQPDYVANGQNPEVISVNENAFDPEAMVAGKVYNITCTGGNNTLNLRGKSGQQASILDQLTNIAFTAQGGNGNGNANGSGNGNGNGNGNGGTDTGSGSDGDTSTGNGNGNGNGNSGGDNSGGGNSTPTVIEQVVIVTNCDVKLDKDTVVRNAIIATSSTDAKSVQGSSGVKIGDPDNCAPGGGAQILTAGGMHFAAKMEFHGSQIASKGPIKLAAQVDGLSGTSIQSLSRVDLASNNAAALCNSEIDEVLELPDGYRRHQ